MRLGCTWYAICNPSLPFWAMCTSYMDSNMLFSKSSISLLSSTMRSTGFPLSVSGTTGRTSSTGISVRSSGLLISLLSSVVRRVCAMSSGEKWEFPFSRSIMNSLPCSGSLFTWMFPWCRSMIPLESASPIPVPSVNLLAPFSSW